MARAPEGGAGRIPGRRAGRPPLDADVLMAAAASPDRRPDHPGAASEDPGAPRGLPVEALLQCQDPPLLPPRVDLDPGGGAHKVVAARARRSAVELVLPAQRPRAGCPLRRLAKRVGADRAVHLPAGRVQPGPDLYQPPLLEAHPLLVPLPFGS